MRQIQLAREQSLERVQRVGEAVALWRQARRNGGVLRRVLPDELGGEATAVPGAVERESGDRRGFSRAAAQQRESGEEEAAFMVSSSQQYGKRKNGRIS
ncbi:MAG: hypothetical protein ACLR4Z_11035 [Butyricicoccaceae bacterium]